MRLFLGISEIAGYYFNLKLGLEALGHYVEYVDISDHPFKYSNFKPSFFIRNLQSVHREYRLSDYWTKRLWWGALATLGRCVLMLWAIVRCDVFIFAFGQSFFRNYELPLLRALGKKVICFVGHGAEARPPYLDGARLFPDGSHPTFDEYQRLVKAIKENLRRIERFASYVICSRQTDHFLQQPYISANFLGIPHQKIEPALADREQSSATVRILHSPSNEIVKGSALIRQTVSKLSMRGYQIKYVEISGKPNDVVMEELSKCDFVIDQLYSDTPLAGFACEAAWFSKPAVVGGYIWPLLKQYLPPDSFPVSEICHPDNLEQTIERLIVDREYRLKLGRQAKQFVESQWNRQIVADRFVQVIQGVSPAVWRCDPMKNPIHVFGGGMPEARVKQLIKFMIRTGGVGALGLSDKPEAERQLLQFVGDKT